MKTKRSTIKPAVTTKEPTPDPDVLIAELPDERAPQLAIAVRVISGRLSKNARGEGDRSKQHKFVKLFQRGLTRVKGRCVADGPMVPLKPWRDGEATFSLIA